MLQQKHLPKNILSHKLANNKFSLVAYSYPEKNQLNNEQSTTLSNFTVFMCSDIGRNRH
jgi:hypothetical protein